MKVNQEESEKKSRALLYRIACRIVRFFYKKPKFEGLENIPEEACVFVGNHTQMNGPIIAELYMPRVCRTWCVGEMTNRKEFPDYAFQDFWSKKPKYIAPFFRLCSFILAPLAAPIFENAKIIPVYRDYRITATFKRTVKELQDNKSIIIFPEQEIPYNNIIYSFQDKFIDIARLYYKKTGLKLKFVPMYICPAFKTVYICKPTEFNPDESMDTERERIANYLMNEISEKGYSLPEHTVVPYPNISKKLYKKNTRL